MTITNHDCARYFEPGKRDATALRRLLAALAWLVTVVVLWCHRERLRWELHKLSELDDHLLKDIGLTRGDVPRTHKQPFWQWR
jgi:uncharacterized protein YjiS (DUF1127 family)